MCFSVWQPDWKAGGRGSREEGKDSFHSGIRVKSALFLGDPAKASTLFWWQASLFHLRGAVDEGSELTRLQQ